VVGLVVVIDGGRQLVHGQLEAFGQQLPREADSLVLEAVAEREVAERTVQPTMARPLWLPPARAHF